MSIARLHKKIAKVCRTLMGSGTETRRHFIKVLKDLEGVEAHCSIDMQVLTDLKKLWGPPMCRFQTENARV